MFPSTRRKYHVGTKECEDGKHDRIKQCKCIVILIFQEHMCFITPDAIFEVSRRWRLKSRSAGLWRCHKTSTYTCCVGNPEHS